MNDYLVLEPFLLFSNLAPLSGRVPGTRCQNSLGARAPVAPVLTSALWATTLVACFNFHQLSMHYLGQKICAHLECQTDLMTITVVHFWLV